MNLKYFNYLIFILFFLPLSKFSFLVTNAQQIDPYLQVDTIKITSDPESMTLIIKVDTSEIKWKSGFRDMITHIEIYDYSNNLVVQTINDTSESNSFAGGAHYVDINLDGYLDIDIDLGVFNLTPVHSFWLFDKMNNRFYYSSDFSQLNEYDIDADKKEINSYSQSTGGRGGYSEKYKIENDKLTLIETSYSNYYDYERKEIINGILRTVELVEQNDDISDDAEMDHSTIIDSYKSVFDSLLLVEKSWLIDIDNNNEDMNAWSSDIYNCGPWGGCLKYLRKEVYSYNKNKGQLTKEILKYQVIDNKWESVEDFIK